MPAGIGPYRRPMAYARGQSAEICLWGDDSGHGGPAPWTPTERRHGQGDQMSGEARVTGPSRTAAACAVGLSKVYGAGDTRVIALDDVGVEFARGQFTAI